MRICRPAKKLESWRNTGALAGVNALDGVERRSSRRVDDGCGVDALAGVAKGKLRRLVDGVFGVDAFDRA